MQCLSLLGLREERYSSGEVVDADGHYNIAALGSHSLKKHFVVCPARFARRRGARMPYPLSPVGYSVYRICLYLACPLKVSGGDAGRLPVSLARMHGTSRKFPL